MVPTPLGQRRVVLRGLPPFLSFFAPRPPREDSSPFPPRGRLSPPSSSTGSRSSRCAPAISFRGRWERRLDSLPLAPSRRARPPRHTTRRSPAALWFSWLASIPWMHCESLFGEQRTASARAFTGLRGARAPAAHRATGPRQPRAPAPRTRAAPPRSARRSAEHVPQPAAQAMTPPPLPTPFPLGR